MRSLALPLAVPLTLAVAGSLMVAGPAGGAPGAAREAQQETSGVTLVGHGYGHGIGMSQYGAYGAARRGMNQRQITSFYYPGTRAGQVSGTMRVLLSGVRRGEVVVGARSRLRVRDRATGAWTVLPSNGARLWRLRTDPSGNVLVGYRGPQQWRFWRKLRGQGEFEARGSAITLHTANGTKRYRGALRLASGDTVNVLGIDNYLKGVVPTEMPASWHPQAVRAQAVAARSYAAWERNSRRGRHFDVYDTVASQVYGGFDAEHPDSNRAVDATAGEVRMWRGGPAFTQFSSSNGGHAAPGSQPYLKAKGDPYDGWSGNTNHDWRVRIADETIERRWPAIGDLRGVAVTQRDGHGEWGGRAVTVRVTGSRGSVSVPGPDFRFALGLRSHWFRVA